MATVRSAETERTTERDRESAVQPVEKERWLGAQPIGLLFITPYVLFLAAIFVYPLIVQFFISFKDYFFAAPGATVDRPWVGFQNYVDVIQDPTFQRSLFNVFEFMIINVPATVFLSLVLAYALNSKMRGLSFFRGAYYAPYVTASVAIVTVWLFMFGETGLVNTVLGSLAPDPSWLINRYWAMPMIAVFVTWKQLGFFILLYLAALQNVPKERYEAADVDGASTVQKFWSVTVPGVRPATTLVIILATITGMNLFTEPYLLTNGGGPNGASVTPVFYMYQKGVEQGQAGYAAAIGMILLVITLGIALVQRRVLERD
jgi:multiple sugar transport system permease protein